MAFLLRAIGLGGSAIPNFNFTLGEEITVLRNAATVPWTMRTGTRNDDGTKVTIFEHSAGGSGADNTAAMDMARNVAKRAKTLMLPGFLRCFDAVEHNNTVYVATEECVPLVHVLKDSESKRDYYDEDQGERFDEGVALGLKHVAQALVALHKHQLVHGNVCNESIFVVKSGEWRLFGLELVAGHNDDGGLYRRYWSILPEYRRPPETLTASTSPAIHNIDAWGIGALVYAVYGGIDMDRLSQAKGADMRACRAMPRSLQTAFTGLTGTNPKLRMSVEKFLTDCDFVAGSEYVLALQQLDELALKDATDRDAVYRHLTTVLDSFPLRACKFIILAKLSVAVQYGGGSATALEPILKIGTRLTDPAVFADLVAPIVMTLFMSPDALVRLRLLSSAAQYAPLLPSNLVNEKIWAPLSTGFNSPNANLRELTVRALVHFAPLLDEKIIVNEVIRNITQLQQDREGPIRTNATICLCLIADHIPQSVRPKTFVHGFGRMLKDPFLPSRLAALRSFSSTLQHLTPTLLAEAVVPGVSPLSLDPNEEVRELVFKLLDGALEQLKRHAATIPATPTAVDAAPGTTNSTPLATQPQNSSAGGSFWGSWGAKATTPAQGSSASSLPSTPVVQHNDPTPATTASIPPVTSTSSFARGASPPPTAAATSWEDELDFQEDPKGSAKASATSLSVGVAANSSGGLKLKKKGFGGGAAKVE